MMLLALVILAAHVPVQGYLNVQGTPLGRCSHTGMALTGWTRNGHCVDYNDDGGSHHICVDLSSTSSRQRRYAISAPYLRDNFCTVTGQSNWCDSRMRCDGNAQAQCPVEHWCVCQWAFSSYIERAGGCESIQDIVCDATNMAALTAYRAKAASDPKIKRALECLESKCLTSDAASTHTADSDRTEKGTDGATPKADDSGDGVTADSSSDPAQNSDAARGASNTGNLVGPLLGALLLLTMVGGAVAIYYHRQRGNKLEVGGNVSQPYSELEQTKSDPA